jgi:adenosylcobinamide-GDP ribazoletransferase
MRPGHSLLADLCVCLGFFTRLPCPWAAKERAPVTLAMLPSAVRMLPFAGALVGGLAAAVLAAAAALGLPSPVAAPLAIGALVLLSGAMHEDGLADCADGFFGGTSRVRKLEIMQDSRIGVFGVVALALSLCLRAASLALISERSIGLACAVLIGAAALSRSLALVPLALLPPARLDGAGFAAGKPARGAFGAAISFAILFAILPVPAGASLYQALTGIGLAAIAAQGLAAFAKRQIGGQTGDVAGAAQQLAELAYCLAMAARG